MGSQKLTGGSSGYYKVAIDKPTTPDTKPYVAECNDIIEALGMNFAEGNAFKALWRMAASRQGNGKPGTTALYDAEKVEFFGRRLVAMNSPYTDRGAPEEEKQSNTEEMKPRRCIACKHKAVIYSVHPCFSCIKSHGHPNWEPEE